MERENDELGEDQELLILYLSGEMPDDQREALERRLEIDVPLKAELERLRAAQAAIWSEMLAADSADPMRGSASMAHRRLAGMVRQWATERLVREPQVGASHAFRRWGLGVAAAAAIAAGVGIYAYWPQDPVAEVIAEATNPDRVELTDEIMPVDEQFVTLTLTEVEQELDELVQLRTLTQ